MLARVASSLSRKVAAKKQPKISARRYSTLYRDPNQARWVPKTDVLQKVLNPPQGSKTVAEAYKQVVAKETELVAATLTSLRAAAPELELAAARNAVQEIIAAVAAFKTPEVDMSAKALQLANPDKIDALIESHEAGRLAATYIDALHKITHNPVAVDLPVETLAASIAPSVRFGFLPSHNATPVGTLVLDWGSLLTPQAHLATNCLPSWLFQL